MDYYDYYREFFDPYARLNRLRQEQAGRPAPQVQPLTPQEEESLLPKVGGAALGGLAYAGSVLEKSTGARALRGLLGGKPRELLSVIPFSDSLLGWTDEADRVSGRDLARQWGLAGQEDTWTNFAGGLGLEALLDPVGMSLTLGPRALTSAGKVAQKAGFLPATRQARLGQTFGQALEAAERLPNAPGFRQYAEAAAGGPQQLAAMLDQPMGGLFGYKVPLLPIEGTFLEGKAGLDALETAANLTTRPLAAAHAGLKSAPYLGPLYKGTAGGLIDALGAGLDAGYRYGKAWFNAPSMGFTSHAGQRAAEEISETARFGDLAARQQALGFADELAGLGRRELGRDPELRMAVEGVPVQIDQVARGVAGRMADASAGRLQALTDLGVPVTEWVDPWNTSARHFPRDATPQLRPKTWVGEKSPLSAADPRVQGGRKEVLEGYLGGTEGVNRALADQAVHTLPPDEAAAHLARQYLAPDATPEHARAAADYLRGLGQRDALFGNHPAADLERYLLNTNRMMNAAEASHNLLAREMSPLAGLGAPIGAPQPVAVREALRKAGLTGDPAMEALLQRANVGRDVPLTLAELEAMGVRPEIADDLARATKRFRAPEEVSALGQAIDRVTSLFKTYTTSLFPAFHARNLASGGFQNVAAAGLDPLLLAGDAARLGRGEVIPWANQIPEFAARGLTPEQATRELAREVAAGGAAGHVANVGREGLASTTPVGRTLDDLLAAVPGERPLTLTDAAKTYVGRGSQPTTWNPLDVRGVGANDDLFAPVAGGKLAGDWAEGVNRNSLFLALRKQGYAPHEAARQVLEHHFDYTGAALTPFEKTWMRRIVPFWTYGRFNTPLTLSQMVTNPGGLTGQYARLADDLRDRETFLPPYLGAGLSLPVGGESPEGRQRYLAGLSLPPEAAFELLKAGGPAQAMMGALGQVNPLFKAPLEYVTGKQFFTGRDLEDLHGLPWPLDNAAVTQAVMNSPVSRLVTTAKGVMDPRKYEGGAYAVPLNFLTGLRFTDVDMPRYKSIAEREYAEGLLRGSPDVSRFERLSVRPEALATLPAEEMLAARLLRTVEKRQREEAEKRKKERRP